MFKVNGWKGALLAVFAAASLLAASCATTLQAADSPSTVTVTATTTATSTVNSTSTVFSTATVTATKTITSTPTVTAPPALTSTVNWPMSVVGLFSVSPKQAPIGASVTATGSGLQASSSYDLMWQDVVGSWNVANGEFYGRMAKEEWLKLATVTTDAQGAFSQVFKVPEGFGFTHDLVLLQSGTIRNKLGFQVQMQVSITPGQGTVGSPVNVTVSGMGWRDYENGWHVQYDNSSVGDFTTVSTHGSGTVTIPATGGVGKHIVRVIEGAYTVAYQNHEECPFPDTPTFNLEYTIVAGAPVMPAPYAQQSLPVKYNTAPAASGQPQIWSDVAAGIVGTPMTVKGTGLPANTSVDLNFITITGNRVSTGGWEEVQIPLGTVKTDASGAFSIASAIPDTIGGDRRIEASVGTTIVAKTSFYINPSIISLDKTSGPVGTVAHFVIKGLSWTVTAKDYYINYDNSLIGYACAMTSHGTINIYLPMTGEAGWHFIDFWNGIYKGTETAKIDQLRTPILNLADHPGETVVAMHFAFQITG